jgi:polar amino acid transport system substrate-binding protein
LFNHKQVINHGTQEDIMRFIILISLLINSHFSVAKEKVNVIAMEYPPFTSSNMENFGSNFVLLKKYAKQHFNLTVQPFFLPPARAHLEIQRNNWCLSFFPPKPGSPNAKFVPLSKDKVALGLYRLHQNNDFTYQSLTELKGRVAVLRSGTVSTESQRLQKAGLRLVYVESIKQGLDLLLIGRVQYAIGDSTTLLSKTGKALSKKIQFSKHPMREIQVGFFYNLTCEKTLFKRLPIPQSRVIK